MSVVWQLRDCMCVLKNVLSRQDTSAVAQRLRLSDAESTEGGSIPASAVIFTLEARHDSPSTLKSLHKDPLVL